VNHKLWRKGIKATRRLGRYGAPHAWSFLIGAAASLLVVAARLAMPWPLRTAVEDWSRAAASGADLGQSARAVSASLAELGLLFLGILLVLGFADFIARLFFARFSIALVHALRRDVYLELVRTRSSETSQHAGDLVARLVGDSARLRSGLQGFFVHVATNGLLLVGVTVVLFFLRWELGLVFLVANLATAVVTAWGAARLYELGRKSRKKEGKLADLLHKSLDPDAPLFAKLSKTSGRGEAAQTKIQGIATWSTHAFFGLAVLAVLIIGGRAIESGGASAGDFVVFLFYALMIRGPIVRVTRQGCRTGKILAQSQRLFEVLRRAKLARKAEASAAGGESAHPGDAAAHQLPSIQTGGAT
jgi:ATP-binding cassette subfamily B protein